MFKFIFQLLFINQETGRLSHRKFWSNVGYFIMSAMFPYAVIYGSAIEYVFWGIFAVVVIGNKTIIDILKKTE